MIITKRTNYNDPDFSNLVKELDSYLGEIDGSEHSFYAQFNKIDNLQNVIIAYDENRAVACGAIKLFSDDSMEVKRMYTNQKNRGKGLASKVLNELEKWAKELGYKKCILETGKRQKDAVAFYGKAGYKIIPNYGQYEGVENSLCFEKFL